MCVSKSVTVARCNMLCLACGMNQGGKRHRAELSWRIVNFIWRHALIFWWFWKWMLKKRTSDFISDFVQHFSTTETPGKYSESAWWAVSCLNAGIYVACGIQGRWSNQLMTTSTQGDLWPAQLLKMLQIQQFIHNHQHLTIQELVKWW